VDQTQRKWQALAGGEGAMNEDSLVVFDDFEFDADRVADGDSVDG
jgi:hypothetical protein